LRADEFLSIFKADGLVRTLAEGITTSKSETVRLKGVSGSLDAVLFAAVFKSTKSDHLIILHDKEEAAYFSNDLQNLLGDREILFFPMSYKRPYEYDETEISIALSSKNFFTPTILRRLTSFTRPASLRSVVVSSTSFLLHTNSPIVSNSSATKSIAFVHSIRARSCLSKLSTRSA
jgi:transcription-repair coupling factor (superfamily II helicase)